MTSHEVDRSALHTRRKAERVHQLNVETGRVHTRATDHDQVRDILSRYVRAMFHHIVDRRDAKSECVPPKGFQSLFCSWKRLEIRGVRIKRKALPPAVILQYGMAKRNPT